MITKSWEVFLLHIAETNKAFDIRNILGETPADNHAPESEFITDMSNQQPDIFLRNPRGFSQQILM